MEETLRICRDQDVLKEYLQEKEAEEIMFTWLDEQRAKKFEYEEIKQEGRAIGRAEGEKIGQAKGKEIGRAEGENKLGLLMNRLLSSGRNSDALRAASDAGFRKQLYQELNIQ